MTLQFAGMTSWSIFLTFYFSCQISGPNLMSISSHVLEFWQFSFIKDWPEIWKSEIPPSEFCPISRDWGKLGTPKLARISLIKCYWMLQNPRVTTFTVSELPGENQRGWGGGVNYPPAPSQIRVNIRSEIRRRSCSGWHRICNVIKSPEKEPVKHLKWSLFRRVLNTSNSEACLTGC